MNRAEQIHRLQQTLLLAPDLRQTVLAELGHLGLNRLAYTPYGAQSAGLPVSTRMGFNGELRGVPHGWYHLGNGHRVFNPILMRFHSPDRLSPFGEGGLNPYAYCLGDPINYQDPTGQWPSFLSPVASIALNAGLLALNAFTFLIAPPAGLALIATRASVAASIGAFIGGGLQLGGIKEGVIVSNIATLVSTASIFTRAGLQLQKVWALDNKKNALSAGFKKLFGIGAPKGELPRWPSTGSIQRPPPSLGPSLAPGTRPQDIPLTLTQLEGGGAVGALQRTDNGFVFTNLNGRTQVIRGVITDEVIV